LALVTYLLIISRSQPTDNDSASEDENTDTAIQSVEENDNIDIEITNSTADDYDQLAIGSACIGCGRCINTDPEHFAYNSSTRQAKVVSQDNLDTTALGRAISGCPVQTIDRT